MSEGRVERRLAAILAADVVGYSRLLGHDEAGTLARLRALRRDLIDARIADSKGRVLKTSGDGMLSEFVLDVDAVRSYPPCLQRRPPSVERSINIGRRQLVTALAGAVAWPLAAQAQQDQRVRRIGVLMGDFPEDNLEARAVAAAFREGLQQLGWTEGRNIRIDTRWAAGDPEAMQRFAKELVGSRPELIFSTNTPATATLLQQTRTIPIVFVQVTDPVGSGFVASISHPGGNVTGFNTMAPTMAAKWLELLKEIAPAVKRVAFLFNPGTAPYFEYYLNPFKAAAPSFAVEAIAAPAHDVSELEAVIATQARAPNGGLIAMPDSFLMTYRAEVISLTARYRLPSVYAFRFFTELGGLLSYGNDIVDNYRRAATYVDRILRGAKPSELPVQAPVKFELVINLKTAKALGLDVPLQLQQRADAVIE